MTQVNAGTKKAQYLISEFKNCFVASHITGAYYKPSYAKLSSFRQIERRALATEGYNYDLKVTSATSQHYSTMYSYTTESGETYIVKDTHANTYVTRLA